MEIGVDCVEISRFENIPEDFVGRVFTDEEIKYCKSFANSAEHFAARFAAKEAVKKSMTKYGNLDFLDIEVTNTDNGAPSVRIKSTEKYLNDSAIKISLAHSNNLAMAFVVVEGANG